MSVSEDCLFDCANIFEKIEKLKTFHLLFYLSNTFGGVNRYIEFGYRLHVLMTSFLADLTTFS